MPVSKVKPCAFTFTLSDGDHRALARLAKSEGRSLANYLRHLIREDQRRKECSMTSETKELIEALDTMLWGPQRPIIDAGKVVLNRSMLVDTLIPAWGARFRPRTEEGETSVEFQDFVGTLSSPDGNGREWQVYSGAYVLPMQVYFRTKLSEWEKAGNI